MVNRRLSVSTEASFITSKITKGTHYVSFWVKDNDYKWSRTARKTLTITDSQNEVPVANIDSINSSPAKEGEKVTFTGSGKDTDGKWSDEVSATLAISSGSGGGPGESNGTVILAFDDGRETDYTQVYPTLKEKG